MLKKILPLLPVLLLAGCTTTQITRLTPAQQVRNADNQYPVEVSLDSRQQSLRWESIKAYVIVNGRELPMRQVPLVKNRWEGLVPIPPEANIATYRFKFDYLFNKFGAPPQPNSWLSQLYTLKVVDQ